MPIPILRRLSRNLINPFIRTVVLTFCLAPISALVGCREDSKVNGLPAKDLFRLHCSSCHGDGSGNGHIAGTLKAKPRDLNERVWQESVSDRHIFKVIANGGTAVKKSKEMPAFRTKLTKQQTQSLVQYIRKMKSSSSAAVEFSDGSQTSP